MKEHIYHIHAFMTVRVDSRVHPWVLKSVNQQIGSFKDEKSPEANPLVIEVKPFGEFSFPHESDTFQNVQGGEDSWYADREARLAITKTQNGYAVYTDMMFSLLGLMQQLFLRQNTSFTHAAALQDPKGKALLLAGAGGVGKTALAGFLVKEKGYKLLGDDMVIVNQSGTCLAFHRPFTLKEYHSSVYPEVFVKRKHMAQRRRLVRSVIWHLYSNAPFRGIFDRLLKRWGVYNRIAFIPFMRKDYVDIVPVSEIFRERHLAWQGPISQTLFLMRSSVPDVTFEKKDKAWMARRMFGVLYEELEEDLKHLLRMGSLGLEDIGADLGHARTVLEKAVSGAPCGLLRVPHEATPEDLARAFEKLILKA